MLPCIVIDFFLNNQPDALIIPNLFCYKTLHVPDIFYAHHQEFSTVHSALVSFMQVCLISDYANKFTCEQECFVFCNTYIYVHQQYCLCYSPADFQTPNLVIVISYYITGVVFYVTGSVWT
jgi:hypothetical protein